MNNTQHDEDLAIIEAATEWRPVVGYEGFYEVSNDGRVKRLPGEVAHGKVGKICIAERELSQQKSDRGYMYVTLCVNHVRSAQRVHRLVAMAFIDNPNGYAEVNHKDRDKTNNNVENLEWCSRDYNQEHACAKVHRFVTPEGGYVEVFNLAKFCRENGLRQSDMSQVWNGNRHDCCGWRGLKTEEALAAYCRQLVEENKALRDALSTCREAIASLDIDALGARCNREGLTWSIRDELVDAITKELLK